jgi:5-hydroxyisourate hydrolase-like protein (transthyretin family)
LRLGVVAILLLGLGGLAFVGQSSSQADAAPFAPPTWAAIPADGKLLVAVTLSQEQDQELTGNLQVELLDADGNVQSQAKQAVRPGDRLASYRFELTADKAKSKDFSLRTRLGNRQSQTPLSRILLVKGHETDLTTGQEFFAGSKAPFRCEVHGVRSARQTVPMGAASVVVRLVGKDKTHTLYEGRTGANGQVDAEIAIPALASGNYTLEVVTTSFLGEEKLQRPIRLKADAKILLLSDKPIYQPGQEMHLRALVLRPYDLKPVENADLLFEIEDGKGNKVFKKTLKTSAFGVASVDFQLADEVNQGDYHFRAEINGQKAEKTVNVKRYVLPRFKVNVTSDKRFYLPKETVKVELQSDYFFGKPVAAGKVEVVASTFDVAFKQFHKWQGQTDEQGHVKLDVKLPDYFVGQPLENGNALVKLDVKVTDGADHSEAVVKNYTVSAQPIQVNLIPEGGRLIPGLDNRVFAAAVYPDGSPAKATVKLWVGKEAKGEPLATVKTNDAGLAEFHVTPKAEQLRPGNSEQQTIEMLGGNQVVNRNHIFFDVVAQAQDRQGSKAQAVAQLNTHPLGENILLRLNKAVFQSADTLELNIHSSAGMPTAYLDIVRGGQIMLSRWLDVKGGEAQYKLDLPPGLFGSVEVHAYQLLSSGEIIRDSRVVYVQPRNDLKVQVKASKDMYKPGDAGRIRFTVTDSAGRPTQAALGVIVVDEAVYALQDLQPGLEKVYFTLQEELLKPQVQIKYQAEPIDNLIRRRILPPGKQQVAEVLLTAVKVQPPVRWQVAPGEERRNRFEAQVQQAGWALFRFAWNSDAYMKLDEKTEKWNFVSDLTQTLQKAGYVHPGMLQDPLGAQLSLEELARTEKGFSLEALTGSITRMRMQRLADAVVKYSETKKAEWFQDGRWQLPGMVLIDAARSQNLDEHWLQDAWGQAFKLVRRSAKWPNATGHAQFDRYDILSAGPDRDFETGDDIRWSHLSGQKAEGWWTRADAESQLALASPTSGTGLGRGGREHFGLDGNQARGDLRRNRGFDDARLRNLGYVGDGRKGIPVPRAEKGKAGEARDKVAQQNGGQPGESKAGQGKEASAPITRVREYFPETLLWQPNLITDENGVADMAINLADSITTWRLSASANSKGGALGGAQAPLKVFQDFFVEPDLPVSLTQNDEVAFPIAVYNYLQEPQTVKLELQKEDWFDLLDQQGLTRELKVKPGDVTAIRYRIRAKRIGFQPIMVKAFGSKMSDAVKRLVEVVPDGQKAEKVISDRLTGKVSHVIAIPENAVPDASKILVRLYPGVMAQVLEGVEGMLRMPGG